MQNFFNQTSLHYGVKTNADWYNAKLRLEQNLTTIIEYYRTRPMRVKSNHFLVSLLNSIPVSPYLNTDRYIAGVEANVIKLGMTFKMTSPMHKGQMHDGIFYGKNVKEVIVSSDEYFDPFTEVKRWRDIEAVKVLSHPRSDLTCMLPNGSDSSFESGVAVIVVNIPLLALQYKCFVIDQFMKLNACVIASALTVEHFIHMYVLPNVLKSHLDYVIFNRFNNFVNGAPQGVSKLKHPFVLMKTANMLDTSLKTIYTQIYNTKRDMKAFLQSIPCVSSVNLEEALKLPEIVEVRQYTWVEVLARIDCLLMLSKLRNKNTHSDDGQIRSILREFILYERDRRLEVYLPKDIFYDTQLKIKEFAMNI